MKVRREKKKVYVQADYGKDILRQISAAMQEKGMEVSELKDVPFTLEETFLALTEAETAGV